MLVGGANMSAPAAVLFARSDELQKT